MQRYYTVNGHWPFPSDMLRHDNATPATPEDAKKFYRLSGNTTDDGYGLCEKINVSLIMEAGPATSGRPCGRFYPNEARWQSFGWTVVEAGADFDADRDLTRRVADGNKRINDLCQSGLAKLTNDEREALGLNV